MTGGSVLIVKDGAIVGRVLSSDEIGRSLQERRFYCKILVRGRPARTVGIGARTRGSVFKIFHCSIPLIGIHIGS
ncbi:hypothetical protein GIB67_002243 [Kingdonia uniflora]|uniref:Uncharacterized protein n=1 Tax=Kingdonia uniflora TaxID=39325 RepID=A0A7J7KX06_9MAGN|nr:hypothetical protein GIB67_002243 [Kingdonia uniflora]